MNNVPQINPTATPAVASDFEIQVKTAKQYPRDMQLAIKNVKAMAISSQDIADSCNYAIPRKNKNGSKTYITGPSIRLAEMLYQSWGNMFAATNISDNNGKQITGKAFVWDLENNNRFVAEVKRNITSTNRSTGEIKTYSEDMQAVTGAAAAAIAFRNAVFKVISKAIVDNLYNEIMNHQFTNKKSIDDKRKSCLDYFKTIGYSEEAVLEFCGKKEITELVRDDLVILGGIKTSIETGIITKETALNKKVTKDENKDKEAIDEFFADGE